VFSQAVQPFTTACYRAVFEPETDTIGHARRSRPKAAITIAPSLA
jgi:hypothetical protein